MKVNINKIRESINKKTLDATYKAQKIYNFEIGKGEHATWNNEADAFKHAYMQWYLTYFHGSGIAKTLGDYHELETPKAPKGETNMDLWNNAIGREIAENMKQQFKGLDLNKESISDYAAKIIVNKMRQGELITNPNDKRQFKYMELERLKPHDRVFYRGETKFEELDEVMSDVLIEQIYNAPLPEKEELNKKVRAGELIYVDNYTRSDGTKVNGYYRRSRNK